LPEGAARPEEFIAEENIYLPLKPRQKEVKTDDDTVKTSNLRMPPHHQKMPLIKELSPLTPILQGVKRRTSSSPPLTIRPS
jgi:hypothetical protein